MYFLTLQEGAEAGVTSHAGIHEYDLQLLYPIISPDLLTRHLIYPFHQEMYIFFFFWPVILPPFPTRQFCLLVALLPSSFTSLSQK
jgi:hypothetical protein